MKFTWRVLPALAVLAVFVTGCAVVDGSPSGISASASSASASAASSGSTRPTSGSVAATLYQRVLINWETGSVAPPYNYEWTVEVTGTSGTLTWKSRYTSSDQTWTATFAVPAGGLDAAARAIVDADRANGPDSGAHAVGGSSASFEVETADGQTDNAGAGGTADSDTLVQTLKDTAKMLVPPEVWQNTEAKYLAWQRAHR